MTILCDYFFFFFNAHNTAHGCLNQQGILISMFQKSGKNFGSAGEGKQSVGLATCSAVLNTETFLHASQHTLLDSKKCILTGV